MVSAANAGWLTNPPHRVTQISKEKEIETKIRIILETKHTEELSEQTDSHPG